MSRARDTENTRGMERLDQLANVAQGEFQISSRYFAEKSRLRVLVEKFRATSKFDIDDEIVLKKGILADLVNDLEANAFDRFSPKAACVKGITDISKAIREDLAFIAQLEGLLSVARVKAWAMRVFKLVQEEAEAALPPDDAKAFMLRVSRRVTDERI